MSRIAEAFARLRREGQTGLVAFLTAGYPEPSATVGLAAALLEGGADLIELGIPFSDPLADGATIQRASAAALDRGVTPQTCLDLAAGLRQKTDRPILLMGYYNPFVAYGLERFAAAAAVAGVDGLIVPDLPPEESDELHAACRANGLDLVFFLAPTSTDNRIAAVAAAASGFIYCVSVTGVTGARTQLDDSLGEFLGRVRRQTDLPLAVGFGVSRAEHVRAIGKFADAAIVGSALIDRIDRSPAGEREADLRQLARELKC